jgi:hypothetical protein
MSDIETKTWNYAFYGIGDEYRHCSCLDIGTLNIGTGVRIAEKISVSSWPEDIWPMVSPVIMIDESSGMPIFDSEYQLFDPDGRVGCKVAELFDLKVIPEEPGIGDDGFPLYSKEQTSGLLERAFKEVKELGLKYLLSINVRCFKGEMKVCARGCK